MSRFTLNITKIMSVLLFIVLVLVSVTSSVFEITFYTDVQKKNDVALKMNITDEELLGVTEIALLYTKGYTNDLSYYINRDDKKIDLYSQQDKVHMVDVQSLYRTAYNVLLTTSVAFFALAVVLLVKRKEVNVFMLTYTYNKVSGYITMFVLFLGGFAYINFNAFWTMFHKVFFSNDLWLMDPRKDVLVNIFPEPLFMALVFKILLRFVIIFAITNVTAYVYRAYSVKVGIKND